MITRFLMGIAMAITLFFLLVSCNNKENRISPSANLGEQLFHQKHIGKNKTIGCTLCHSLKPNEKTIGPNLQGIGTRAGVTKQGMDAKRYLLESIIDPDAYIVPSYMPSVMVANYANELSDIELESLVLYLQTQCLNSKSKCNI